MVHLVLAQVMPVRLPRGKLKQHVGYTAGKVDMACVAAVHHPCGHAQPASCHIHTLKDIPEPIYRPRVRSHSNPQFRAPAQYYRIDAMR